MSHKRCHIEGEEYDRCFDCGLAWHLTEGQSCSGKRYSELREETDKLLNAWDEAGQLAEAKAVLREVEWFPCDCPICHAAELDGHAPDCRLAKVIGE